ncbi:MAG: hypothetical protein M1833_002040 [Piccolia ochrophora]|nr:MAG: hypothetical protein M1833_002040 [Piccolia ochrophora]
MRIHVHSPSVLALSLFFFGSPTSSLHCNEIVAKGQRWDLSPLEGPHTVSHIDDTDPLSPTNTTYHIDICRPLPKHKPKSKEEKFCKYGTIICALDTHLDEDEPWRAIEIAGEYTSRAGDALEDKYQRLKDSNSNSDSEKEGVRGNYHGGEFKGYKQKAIVEFLCDPEREGTRARSSDEDDPERKESDDDNPIKFKSYSKAPDEKVMVLRLDWRTKYACEDATGGRGSSSGHWGFFTWFIIIAFLGTAAYLIFGSWLNYTKYGARGWDLLPHGDTIRDMPYLLKDWSRRVVSTVQGHGSRGGYSAV